MPADPLLSILGPMAGAAPMAPPAPAAPPSPTDQLMQMLMFREVQRQQQMQALQPHGTLQTMLQNMAMGNVHRFGMPGLLTSLLMGVTGTPDPTRMMLQPQDKGGLGGGGIGDILKLMMFPGQQALTEARTESAKQGTEASRMATEAFAGDMGVGGAPGSEGPNVGGAGAGGGGGFKRGYTLSPRGVGMTFTPQDTLEQEFEKAKTKAAGTAAGKPEELTSTTRTMIEKAPSVIDLAQKSMGLVDQNAAKLGPMKGRFRDFMVGTVGKRDPSFSELRTNMKLLSTLLTQMHVGSRSATTIVKEFQKGLVSSQDPENLKATLGAIIDYANEKLAQGKTGKGGPAGVPMGPKVGETIQIPGGPTIRRVE